MFVTKTFDKIAPIILSRLGILENATVDVITHFFLLRKYIRLFLCLKQHV